MAIYLNLVLFLACVAFSTSNGDYNDPQQLAEEQGYFTRQHSLGRPFQGRGSEVPFWEFEGSTVLTNDYIRLTPDRQSKRGSLWNIAPVRTHNWEIVVEFAVHGSGKNLFGDGFAMWYTKDKNKPGAVFGNQDYFTGLGIFFDTYSNHNGEHSHEHPYISAMVNNGSLHYDHDRDGTHSQMAGCHAKFRNSDYTTLIAVSYVSRQLTVMTNFDESTTWSPCLFVNDVDLPIKYYLGFTAATGDLADNHDIISVKFYDIDSTPTNSPPQGGNKEDSGTQATIDWESVMPSAKTQEKPRPHVDDPKSYISPFWYRLFSISFMILLVVGVVAVIGGMAWKKQQAKNKKRFF